MSIIYRDRAYCIRSACDELAEVGCLNRECDRFVTETVLRLSDESGLNIGWADLKTSKCGFVPRDAE